MEYIFTLWLIIVCLSLFSFLLVIRNMMLSNENYEMKRFVKDVELENKTLKKINLSILDLEEDDFE